MSLFLDTTVLIDVLAGRPATERLRRARGEERVFTSAINVEELAFGLRADEHRGFRRLLDWVRIVPLGRTEGERAAAWRRSFGAAGQTLHQADCLIAAAALRAGARLATGNPDDFPMNDITVEVWPPGR